VQKTLGNEGFVNRAKPEIVARERARLTELTQTRETLEARLNALPV
jgi:valyl-tRNA synthetase